MEQLATKLAQPITPPNFGALVGDSFLNKEFANDVYDGHFLVRYSGPKQDHRPTAHFISRDAACDREWFVVSLTQHPTDPPDQIVKTGEIFNLEAHYPNGPTNQSWHETQDPISLPMTYWVEGWADYNNGGAGPDSGVIITGKSYTNGVWLYMACQDYSAGFQPPDWTFNDKIYEMFFPLTYGTDFKHLTRTPPQGSPYRSNQNNYTPLIIDITM
jgi:hypothetical protein